LVSYKSKRPVILSEASASQSEGDAQSKDPAFGGTHQRPVQEF
jgi:hypothetical protein